MRSLSSRERRLLMLLLVAGFIILNFLGYQTLAQRRTAAVAQQRTLRFDIARLKELQNAKPTVDVNSDWLNAHLPAYADIDQFETHLFNVVSSKAVAADVELTKKDPRPAQKDGVVHRSIMEIETTAEMEKLVTFLHSLQGREDFRFISFLELTPTKDEERVRCQARIEQWWSPNSEAAIAASDLPVLPATPRPAGTPAETKPAADAPASENPANGAAEAPAAEPPASTPTPPAAEEPRVEQPAPETVQPPAPPPAATTPPQ